jgi:cell division protein FtsX
MSHLFSAAAVGFLLLVAGFLYWLQAGLKPVVSRLRGEQVITAYLSMPAPSVALQDPPQPELDKLGDTIRTAIGAHAEDVSLEYVGAQKFVDHLKGPYPELARELEDLGPEMASVVPRYFSVTGVFNGGALERVRAVPGIESAESSRDRYARVVGAFVALRWVARLLASGALLALLTGLVQLSRLSAYMHRETLSILRLWGAGALEVRAPAMVSGALVGLAGGALAATGWIAAGQGLSRQIRALSPMLGALPEPGIALALGMALAGLAIGLCAGALGGVAGDDPREGARA